MIFATRCPARRGRFQRRVLRARRNFEAAGQRLRQRTAGARQTPFSAARPIFSTAWQVLEADFARLDTGGDGSVDYEELLAGVNWNGDSASRVRPPPWLDKPPV